MEIIAKILRRHNIFAIIPLGGESIGLQNYRCVHRMWRLRKRMSDFLHFGRKPNIHNQCKRLHRL